jgi:hypothetical protein
MVPPGCSRGHLPSEQLRVSFRRPSTGTATTRPAPSTTRKPATTRAPHTSHHHRRHSGRLPAGWWAFTTGPATTASASPQGSASTPGSATTPPSSRSRAGSGGCSPCAPRPRPHGCVRPPGTTEPGHGATSLASARSATPRARSTSAAGGGGVRVRGGPGRPADSCQPHQRQGQDLGLQRRVHRPGRPSAWRPGRAVPRTPPDDDRNIDRGNVATRP